MNRHPVNNRMNPGGKKKFVVIDGVKFFSKGEAERYLELCEEKAQGKVVSFQMQVKYLLLDGYTNGDGEKIRPIHYLADFVIINPDGSKRVEDVKGWGGFTMPDYKLKKKLFELRYHPLVINEVQRKGKLPKNDPRITTVTGREKPPTVDKTPATNRRLS